MFFHDILLRTAVKKRATKKQREVCIRRAAEKNIETDITYNLQRIATVTVPVPVTVTVTVNAISICHCPLLKCAALRHLAISSICHSHCPSVTEYQMAKPPTYPPPPPKVLTPS